jgi:hypothetical protein
MTAKKTTLTPEQRKRINFIAHLARKVVGNWAEGDFQKQHGWSLHQFAQITEADLELNNQTERSLFFYFLTKFCSERIPDAETVMLQNLALECKAIAKQYSEKYGRPLYVCMPDSLETLEQWRKEGIENYLYDEQDRSLADTGMRSAAEANLMEQINEKVDAILAATDREKKRRSKTGRKGGKKNAGRIKDAPAARKKAIEDARGHLSRYMTQEAAFTTAIEDNGLDITWQALRAAYLKKYPPKNKGGRFK